MWKKVINKPNWIVVYMLHSILLKSIIEYNHGGENKMLFVSYNIIKPGNKYIILIFWQPSPLENQINLIASTILVHNHYSQITFSVLKIQDLNVYTKFLLWYYWKPFYTSPYHIPILLIREVIFLKI